MQIIVSVEGADLDALAEGLEHAASHIADPEEGDDLAPGGGLELSGPIHTATVVAYGETLWTEADQQHAAREGWGLFLVSGGRNHGLLQVQYLGDEIEAPGVPPGTWSPFETDPQAQVHVLTQAEAGSALHRRALLAICTHPAPAGGVPARLEDEPCGPP